MTISAQPESLEIIRAQRDALVRAQRQKEELAALLVHDLKSPLASMLAGTEFLSREKGLSKEGIHCANDILRAGEVLKRMVMNLLDISRSEDGALVPQFTELDLGALVAQIKGQVTPTLINRDIAINTEIQGNPRIHADRDLVRRILENLLDNAIKCTPKGSAIRLEATKVEGATDIRICDQGPGIPLYLREKVFEKYVRLDREASQHVCNGMGLGLAFCRKAVEAHRGLIWIEENYPCGSKFCVRLPHDRLRGIVLGTRFSAPCPKG